MEEVDKGCSEFCVIAFSALTLLVGWQEGHLAYKKTEWWGAADVVICLDRGADLHMAQLMPLPLTVSCFSKIKIGFTFLVLAHPGPLNGCVCVCVRERVLCNNRSAGILIPSWLTVLAVNWSQPNGRCPAAPKQIEVLFGI